MQMNVRAGLTFASACGRSFEPTRARSYWSVIRDRETALIAIEAALTGHLVLVTHTNDAASSLPRLVEMGVEPIWQPAPGLRGGPAAGSQALPREQEAYSPPSRSWGGRFPRVHARRRPGDVPPGGMHGVLQDQVQGRMGLYEVMPISEEIERSGRSVLVGGHPALGSAVTG